MARALADSAAEMATLAIAFEDCETLFDPNAVKVVRDSHGLALYFSRAPIPWHRDRFALDRVLGLPSPALRHIGIYAYRAGFLGIFSGLDPSYLFDKNADLSRLYDRITLGTEEDPGPLIRDRFGARYVFSDNTHHDFFEHARNSGWFDIVYEDAQCTIMYIRDQKIEEELGVP